jgi:hypothetical protein
VDEFDPNYDTKPPGSVMARPNFIELPTRDLAASQDPSGNELAATQADSA